MKTISFHKQHFKCPKCGDNEVDRWDKLCGKCKTDTQAKVSTDKLPAIGRRMPAAVIQTDDGREIFVDKHGKEVKNHGYDLQRDPRGWERNGRLGPKRKII